MRKSNFDFRFFAGLWHVDRRIEPGGNFVGEAQFTPRSSMNIMEYQERGWLTTDEGVRTRASRNYLYEKTMSGFLIRFHDTHQIFHSVDVAQLAEGISQGFAKHQCGDDLYKSTYRFESGKKTFEILHVVKGPRKDYTSNSRLKSISILQDDGSPHS